MAAEVALRAAGVAEPFAALGRDLLLVLYGMTIGIMGGIIISILLSRRIQTGTLTMKAKDPAWRALSHSVFLSTVIIVLAAPVFSRFSATLMIFLTGAAARVLLRRAEKKHGFGNLREFSMAIGMAAAMLSSLLWTKLFN
jgi:hypothetical protein